MDRNIEKILNEFHAHMAKGKPGWEDASKCCKEMIAAGYKIVVRYNSNGTQDLEFVKKPD